MHIPEHTLAPAVSAVTGLIGLAGFGFAMRRLGDALRDRAVVMMGMMSAFVFAAQMVNFPVFLGVSGHLIGGVLAAVLLGPWAGAAVIGSVLIVQCLLMADGGPTALGANFVNMGLVGSVLGYAIYAPIRRLIGGSPGVIVGAMVAAWISVILSALALAVELAAGGRGGFLDILGWMLLVHAAIGLGEAVITGLVLESVLLVRPDLVHDPEGVGPGRAGRWWQAGAAGLAVALAVAAFLAPFASEWPDGFEFVGAKLGLLAEGDAPSTFAAPLADYRIPGMPPLKWVTAAAGVAGTLAVAAVGGGLAWAFARRAASRRPVGALAGGGVGPDAA
jgi:cobalt/nickel transport system permease protein